MAITSATTISTSIDGVSCSSYGHHVSFTHVDGVTTHVYEFQGMNADDKLRLACSLLDDVFTLATREDERLSNYRIGHLARLAKQVLAYGKDHCGYDPSDE